ncbi:sigma factor [Thauera butanivorans]|uniref:sigma factor n=1 Tax=Thauera butanivorans TaxID=86174 RepID=UPI0009FED41C|nr:sigma factor [Thauera butanivorans]
MKPAPAEFDSPFEQLYAAHHGWLRAWLRRRLECTDQACDLVQDVFIRVLSQRHVEDLREPRAYLSSARRFRRSHRPRRPLRLPRQCRLAGRRHRHQGHEAAHPIPQRRLRLAHH